MRIIERSEEEPCRSDQDETWNLLLMEVQWLVACILKGTADGENGKTRAGMQRRGKMEALYRPVIWS